MTLTAIKDHVYFGRRIKAGQDYEVHSKNDAVILQVAGLARPKKIEKIQEVRKVRSYENQAKEPVEKSVEKPAEESAEEPAEEKAEEVTEETISSEEPTQRKRKRQYKRHDMVPED